MEGMRTDWGEQELASLTEAKAELEATIEILSGRLAALEAAIEALRGESSQEDRPIQVRDHPGKYRGLWEWLRRQESDVITARFSEIEGVLGFPLPPSSRRYLPHWYGYEGSAVARAIRDAGFKARKVRLDTETGIVFRIQK